MAQVVVMMESQADREALQGGGVLPAGTFHSFDELAGGRIVEGDGLVYLWPHDPGPMMDAEGRPSSLAVLVGKPDVGEEGQRAEVYFSHLFGKTLVHVMFLDKASENGGFVGRKVSFDSLDKVRRWGVRFDEAIRSRFSDEQARTINHVLVLVARGGQVTTTRDELEKFLQCLKNSQRTYGCLTVCYFLDYNLEVEDGSVPLFHSEQVWPVMVSRLLLRLLMVGGWERDGKFLSPGFHLWRAEDFVFGLPTAKMSQIWESQLRKSYLSLEDTTTRTVNTIVGTDSSNLTAREVFSRVHEHPSEIFSCSRDVSCEMARVKNACDSQLVFDAWREVILRECERKQIERDEKRVVKEFESAQAHALSFSLGAAVTLAVTFFLGFALLHAAKAIGFPWPIAMLFGCCSAVGAFLAWLILASFHNKSKKEGMALCDRLLREKGEKEKSRKDAADKTIRQACDQEKSLWRWNVLGGIKKLIDRIARIVGREIQTPTATVFFRDKDGNEESLAQKDFAFEQRASLLEVTRHVTGDDDTLHVSEEMFEESQQYTSSIFGSGNRDADSFVEKWYRMTDDKDADRHGNYPARYFIPELRAFMQGFCDKLSGAMKRDVLASRGGYYPSPLSDFVSSSPHGFPCASAHVDGDQVQDRESAMFVSENFYQETRNRAGDRYVVKCSALFDRLSLYAFFFQDIKINPVCNSEGKLVCGERNVGEVGDPHG